MPATPKRVRIKPLNPSPVKKAVKKTTTDQMGLKQRPPVPQLQSGMKTWTIATTKPSQRETLKQIKAKVAQANKAKPLKAHEIEALIQDEEEEPADPASEEVVVHVEVHQLEAQPSTSEVSSAQPTG